MSVFRGRCFGVPALSVFLLILLSNIAGAQGVPTGGGLDLAPTNPLGMPGSTGGYPAGSNSLYLNSGMLSAILPPIPNFEIGYQYDFGNKIRTGRLTLDYVLPARVRNDQAFFGEAHGEFTNFWKTLQRIFHSGDTTTTYSGFNERTDLSLGAGYRKLLNPSLMLGVNGFYDATLLSSSWYGSGGLGLEMAALGAGNDLVEFNFNYYGDIFQGRNSIINAFRNGPLNYDASIAYSLQLGDDGPDLRLKLTGYRFDIGAPRYGLNADAELKSKSGVWSFKVGSGHDPVNGWYHSVGGFVNVGVQFSKIFSGESPFAAPEPIFKSPRNLRRLLSRKVDRQYLSPPALVARGGGRGGGETAFACPQCSYNGHPLPRGNVVWQAPPVDVNAPIPPFNSVYISFGPSTIPATAPGITRALWVCVSNPHPEFGRQFLVNLQHDVTTIIFAVVDAPCIARPPFLAFTGGAAVVNRLSIVNSAHVPWTPGVVTAWITEQ